MLELHGHCDVLSFQSTLPSRGVTGGSHLGDLPVSISIHTPLAGSDASDRPAKEIINDFNPHSPRGE